MSLIQDLRDMKIRMMKQHDKNMVRYNVLGTLIAEASKQDKEPEDKVVVAMIKKFIDNANLVLKHDSTRLEPQVEIEFLSQFLPKQLTEAEIRKIVQDLDKFGMKEIMGLFKTNYPGQYDGGLVSKIAKELVEGVK